MNPGSNEAVRKWVAPHPGFIRIEGAISVNLPAVIWDPGITYVEKVKTNNFSGSKGKDVKASICKNKSDLMSVSLSNNGNPVSYDLYVQVNTDDSIYFTVE